MATAQEIIDQHIRPRLNDPDGITWSNTFLMPFLNDALRVICVFKPDAHVKTTAINKTVGSQQALPSDAQTLTDVIRNQNGATPGRSISKIPRRVLDVQRPGWHNEPAQAESKAYVFDPKEQRHFYLHPPSNGTGQVLIVYPAIPATIAIGGTIPIDDIYIPAITHYVCSCAYLIDSGYAADDARANAQDQRFINLLSGKEAGERASEPRSKIGRANRTVGEE